MLRGRLALWLSLSAWWLLAEPPCAAAQAAPRPVPAPKPHKLAPPKPVPAPDAGVAPGSPPKLAPAPPAEPPAKPDPSPPLSPEDQAVARQLELWMLMEMLKDYRLFYDDPEAVPSR
jgi:hypothetical protein